jgi:hypothetical protein
MFVSPSRRLAGLLTGRFVLRKTDFEKDDGDFAGIIRGGGA